MQRGPMKNVLLLLVLFQCCLSSGCDPFAGIGYSPPIIPIKISVDTNGQVNIALSPELCTPIGTFSLEVGATVYDFGDQYVERLLIIRVDDRVSIYHITEGKEFKIEFKEDKLYKKVALNYENDGDIILELQSVNLRGWRPPASAPKGDGPILPCTNVRVSVLDTPDGDILHIEGCGNWIYDSSPLAKGEYALSPNGMFLVYCTYSGDLYALRYGEENPRFIENLEKKMSVFHSGEVSLEISVYKGEHQYFVNINDRFSGQSATAKIPLLISE